MSTATHSRSSPGHLPYEDPSTRKQPRSWKPRSRLDWTAGRVGDCGEKSGFPHGSHSDSVRSTTTTTTAARSSFNAASTRTNRLSSTTTEMTTLASCSFMEVTTEDQVILEEQTTTTSLSVLNLMQWLQTACPVDVVPLVLAYSGPQQTAAMSRVNRHWRTVVQQESTWRVLCEQLYKVSWSLWVWPVVVGLRLQTCVDSPL
jgi:hypothetical protein